MPASRIVFTVAAVVATLFVLGTAFFPGRAATLAGQLQDGIVSRFGWFYILSVALFLFFSLWLMLSRYGRIRLGDDEDEPDYGYLTWFAMLFAAGMGIGILFYGVAEPMLHFGAPRFSEPGSIAAAKEAMETTFFHWGLHAWAIYIVVGLSLAYFGYRHGLPLTVRSTLYPLLGERIHGPLGHLVDVMAVLGTLFGIATSLGFGVLQVGSGLAFLGWLPATTTNHVLLIAAITAITMLSAASGLDRGVRRLSELNVLLAIALVCFVFIVGPTVFLLSTFVESVGLYLQELVLNSFRTTAFRHAEWQKTWTMFYWGWWISWAPFVGMFIARISRGRTIREFIAGVMFVPTLFAFFWFAVLGNTAIHLDLFQGGKLAAAVAQDVPTALFKMLESLPLAQITTVLAVALVATFFVTSADSGALVIDTIVNGGRSDGPAWRRAFWAVLTGAIAAVLLVAGGLQGLQSAAIATALPFAVIMLAMCAGLLKALRAERDSPRPATLAEDLAPAGEALNLPPHVEDDWRARLRYVAARGRGEAGRGMRHPARLALAAFIRETVLPALEEVAAEMRRNGREILIDRHPLHAGVTVMRDGREEFFYVVKGRVSQRYAATIADLAPDEAAPAEAEIVVRGGHSRTLPLETLDRSWLLEDFSGQYGRWMGW